LQISIPPNLDFPHVDLIVGFPSTKLFCGQIVKKTVLGIGSFQRVFVNLNYRLDLGQIKDVWQVLE
jgi:hypothetical protein